MDFKSQFQYSIFAPASLTNGLRLSLMCPPGDGAVTYLHSGMENLAEISEPQIQPNEQRDQ